MLKNLVKNKEMLALLIPIVIALVIKVFVI